jgi:hypothetical protein
MFILLKKNSYGLSSFLVNNINECIMNIQINNSKLKKMKLGMK